jgi:hypothetical protein
MRNIGTPDVHVLLGQYRSYCFTESRCEPGVGASFGIELPRVSHARHHCPNIEITGGTLEDHTGCSERATLFEQAQQTALRLQPVETLSR